MMDEARAREILAVACDAAGGRASAKALREGSLDGWFVPTRVAVLAIQAATEDAVAAERERIGLGVGWQPIETSPALDRPAKEEDEAGECECQRHETQD